MKQKIVIIEGVDRIGKTTLCKALQSDFNFKIFDRPSDGFNFAKLKCGDVGFDICKTLKRFRDNKQSIIFDRLHLSEYVYGKLDRKYDERDNVYWFDVAEMFMEELDVTLILGRPCDLAFTNNANHKDVTPYDEVFLNMYLHSKIRKKCMYRYDHFDRDYVDICNAIESNEVT